MPKQPLTERGSKSPFIKQRPGAHERNPIIGNNVGDAEDSSQVRKKRIEYQPSKTYDTMNKKRYMLASDMVPLD